MWSTRRWTNLSLVFFIAGKPIVFHISPAKGGQTQQIDNQPISTTMGGIIGGIKKIAKKNF
jgi:hypothetical protein